MGAEPAPPRLRRVSDCPLWPSEISCEKLDESWSTAPRERRGDRLGIGVASSYRARPANVHDGGANQRAGIYHNPRVPYRRRVRPVPGRVTDPRHGGGAIPRSRSRFRNHPHAAGSVALRPGFGRKWFQTPKRIQCRCPVRVVLILTRVDIEASGLSECASFSCQETSPYPIKDFVELETPSERRRAG